MRVSIRRHRRRMLQEKQRLENSDEGRMEGCSY
jgi:hypothetical protein